MNSPLGTHPDIWMPYETVPRYRPGANRGGSRHEHVDCYARFDVYTACACHNYYGGPY